jgi:DtxR family transcriptional regulator, Mn-dependent transcriptional regulator
MSSYKLSTKTSYSAPSNAESDSTITVSKEDYLKAIAEIEAQGEMVIAATLSRWLGVSPPSVAAAIKRLRRDALVKSGREGRLTLTSQGRAIAERLLLRHYLIERALSEIFGMEWYKIHDEAERLEHAVSVDFEKRLFALLGADKPCPHGNPAGIETPEVRHSRGWMRLSEVGLRGFYKIAGVDERERKLLEFLDSFGLRPAVRFEWRARNYDDTITLAIGRSRCRIGLSAAARVWVVPTSGTE